MRDEFEGQKAAIRIVAHAAGVWIALLALYQLATIFRFNILAAYTIPIALLLPLIFAPKVARACQARLGPGATDIAAMVLMAAPAALWPRSSSRLASSPA
ncbi:hypothetical protein SAMN05421666_2273 [Roseovarius nanhaiticus]|uniref:Uncharacterized protein n=1 Tax=Roseovarius nanhaiticus TaxID=573024 RepID=A0A1N7GZE6_9RHOB|nr:hypothetical protein [Roseovarius nanhaiticus]SEL18770.1 hypothetical protein SAMN05216208_3046 [Roseovarius nanhaiticus]SIS17959.1 hypothetical protein SAMN05421666_2273 [Roseovarius nanhaiticus]